MSYVTGISGNVISAASAGWAPTNSADVSAIASAYATGAEQVVTSLQYATSESATVASTVTADTAIGYGARDISAEYPFDDSWTYYESSTPLIKVRMTSDGNMRNYSSYPLYLYMVPYGATNQGSVSNTGDITGALAYGEFSGGMHDFLIAEGTASAYSLNPSYVDVTFDVTHVPFVDSQPAWWGTVPGEHYGVVDNDESTRPVFCVAGGYDGSQLFELRSNTTAEVDFGSIVTVSAVSGINELEIAGAGGGIDSATVSAIASSYAENVSAAASGAVSTVASNSADWMKLSKCFSGIDGIVTAVGSSTILTASASSFMGIGSAIKSTTGSGAGFFPDIKYAMGLSGYYQSIKLSAGDWQTYVQCMDGGGSISTIHLSPTAIVTGVSGDISAYSTTGSFTLDYTADSIEPLAFQRDLPTYQYDAEDKISSINGSAIAGGAGGVDSATVSAIASSYAESAASSKLDESATADFYSTSNPSGFITGVDLSNYATTAYVDSSISSFVDSSTCSAIASSYAESAVSSKADESALSGYYTTANESGFLTGLPAFISATRITADSARVQSALDVTGHARAYKSNDNKMYGNFDYAGMFFRSGDQRPYNIGIDSTGSNFYIATAKNGFERIYASSIQSWNGKADSSALSSYALSADVSGTVDLVSTQSANWGGSALALSAGPGVKLEKVGDTLVASTDETVLWSGELSEAGTVTAAESLADFEKIELHWHTAIGSYPIIDSVHINDNTPSVCFVHGAGASNAWIQWCMCSASANTFTVVRGKSLNFGAYNSTAATYTVSTSLGDSFQLNKIVGINRTAGV